MAKVHYISHSGEDRAVEVPTGESVMRGAVANSIPGIDADCGGQCACATCHVYVDEAWLKKIEAPGEMEASMLAFVDGAQPNSRLSCQINVTPELDGLIVRLPESQH
ncbi:MAG: 2Fe-2S iron-sulfur cluster binding domain-containing protein [Hyphomicrobiales bacterium]|nr:2Fe-2S iron-sulfur cluster binding domain-containing protein [Hyphomicrobiales bacterium]